MARSTADSTARSTADFTMPSLGADMEAGTVLEWLVHPGDPVRRGQTIAVIDTAKAAVEIESFVDGVLDDVVVEPGTEVPVGTVIAHIRPAAAAAPAPVAPPQHREEPRATARTAPPPKHEHVTSPLVRKLAHDEHVDLTRVHGTGPGGAITRDDVRQAAHAPSTGGRRAVSPYARRLADELGVDLSRLAPDGPPARAADVRDLARTPGTPTPARPPAPTTTPTTTPDQATARRREAVAALMTRSKQEIPHFYLSATIDLEAATRWLATVNAGRPASTRLVPAALLLKAAARAAREVPHLNGHWVEGAFRAADRVDLGIAVSLRDGTLVAPALRSADELEVDVLMGRLRDLVQRARSGRLHGDEAADPSITVTSLGDLGVDSVLPVIYPPQVAMLGLGTVAPRPCAVDGMLTVRPVVTASLAVDHRASDGHRAAVCLRTMTALLQRPEDL